MQSKRINVWSSPRNISTALMYAFAQRSDTTVVDEPLYAHYLTHIQTDAEHPGREAILASQSSDAATVIQQVLLGTYPTPLVFFKQMTHHLIELDRSFLSQMDNILLIRDPRAIIASYSKVIPSPTMADIGVAAQHQLFKQLVAQGKSPLILDTRELLLSPKRVLQQLCARLDIPFTTAMLSWEAGARPEDGVWAPHWYENVHQSTGFLPYQEKKIDLSPALEELATSCAPHYQQLYKHSIKADD